MHTRFKKLLFLIIPLLGIALCTSPAFAKKKHCKPRYNQSYYDCYGYDRGSYDPYYGRGRYNDRYYDRYDDDDDYYRRRTYSRPRYNDGYYGGSYYPPGGSIPWWDIFIPRY